MTLPAPVEAAMAAGRESVRGLIKFEFGGGTYRFVRDSQPLFDGVDTWAPGAVIDVSDLPDATGLSASGFTVSLTASPDDGLTPAVLASIEGEDYSDRPVTIYDAHLDADTGALLHIEPLKRGYVDAIDHEEGNGRPYTITAHCETRSLDYSRTNGRYRSHADQQRRAPGDLFYEHASRRGREEIYWGRKRSPTPAPWTGGGTFPGRPNAS